ncbi:MAG: TatD family hydrolase [Terriglobales bacterium]
MFIDSHCHPDGDEYDADRAAVLMRAAEAGVNEIVAIGGGGEPGTLDVALQVAAQQPAGGAHVWCTVGIHPHEARRASAASYAEMAALARDLRVVAIGEIGLDYHYTHSSREVQQEVFRRQLQVATEADLPITIHCREAWEDCLGLLRAHVEESGAGWRQRGVFHCFNGDAAQAATALELGFSLAFSGLLTFPKLGELRDIARSAPADRVIIETDAPFLAPVPHRGRRNEPAWVVEVGRQLAALRGWTLEQTGEHTTANFRRIFPRAAGRTPSF